MRKKVTPMLFQRLLTVMFFAAQVFGIGTFVFLPSQAQAAIPTTIGYQGRLKNSSGTAQSGTFSFIFRLYASSTGGAALWTETQSSVAVDQGAFEVQLGSVTPFPVSLDFNQPLFLTTEVNGDGEMSPRITLNTVPYAYTAGGINALASAPGSATGGRMFYNTTNGSLNYYDNLLGSWTTLGVSASSSGLQAVTNVGSTTTNAIQFAGGTSTANFASLAGLFSATGVTIGTNSTIFGDGNLYKNSAGDFRMALNNPASSWRMFTSSTEVLTVASTSRVGIGLPYPQESLDVAGNIQNTLLPGQSFTAVTTTPIGNNPHGVVVAGRYAYVVLGGDNQLDVLDITNAVLTHQGSQMEVVGTVGVGANPVDVVLGSYAYVANKNSDSVSIVDVSKPAAPLVISTVGVGSNPNSIALSAGYIFTANSGANTVSIVNVNDAANPFVATTTVVGLSPSALYVEGHFLYVTNQGSNSLSILNISDPEHPITVTTSLGNSPAGITVAGRFAFISNSGNSTVSTVDVSDQNAPVVVATTSVGNAPTGIISSGRYVYVTNQGSGTVTILDAVNPLQTPSTIATIPIGSSPDHVAINGRSLLVTNSGSNSITDIDVKGMETNGLIAGSASVGSLQVQSDTQISNKLTVGGELVVDGAGIFTSGQLVAAQLNVGQNFFVDSPGVLQMTAQAVPPSPSTVAGRAKFYSVSDNGTTALEYADPSGLVQRINRDIFFLARNQTGSTITKGQSVYINGSFGSVATVGLAKADSTSTVPALGLAAEDIPNLGYGRIIQFGQVSNINTSAFTVGDGLWISSTVAGGVTNSDPGSPFITQPIGTVLFSSAVSGTIQVFSRAPSGNGQGTILSTWNIGNGSAGAKSLAFRGTAVGTLSWNPSATHTIAIPNVDGNMVVATGTLTGGSIPFAIADGSLAQNNGSLFWDATNARLGIGTNAPGFMLTVNGTSSLQGLTFSNGTGTSATTTNFFATTGTFTNLNVTNNLSGGPGLTWTNASGTNTTSTNFAVSTYARLPTDTKINNVSVCLLDGTNCPSGASPNFQTVTNSGNTTTKDIQFNGGTSTGAFTIQNNLTVTGTSALTDVTWGNATGTNTTSTNLFATTASSTNLFAATSSLGSVNIANLFGQNATFTSATMTNLSVSTFNPTNLTWTNGTGTNTTSTNLFAATTVLTSATTTNLFATTASATTLTALNLNSNSVAILGGSINGTVIGNVTPSTGVFTNATATAVTSTNLFATAASATTFNVVNLLAVNATTTNATTTNLTVTGANTTTFAAGVSSTAGNFLSYVMVNGKLVCLSDGTNCPSGTSPNFQTVTNSGNTTTKDIQFNGGTSTGAFTIQNNLTVTGTSALTDVTWGNATGTNTTSTNLFVTTGVVNALTASGLAWMNATGVSVTTTNLAATNAVLTNATFTTATSTNFFATTGTFTNLSVTNALSGGPALTWTNASGTNTTSTNFAVSTYARLPTDTKINNVSVCLLDGTNCPSGTSPNFQTVTNSGNTTTKDIQFNGGTSTGAFTIQNNLTVTGTTALQGLTWTSGTGTNTTSTNLFATTASATTLTALNLNANFATTSQATTTNLFATSASATTLTALNLTATNATLLGGTALLSSSTITNLTWTNSTGTNTTSTNSFATTASSTNLFAATSSLGSVNIANLFGQNATFTSATMTNLSVSTFNPTNLTWTNGTGTNTTNTNLFVTNEVASGLTWTNATGTNTTSTNEFATNVRFTNGTSTGWLGFAIASGTTMNALTVNAAGMVSPNVTITGGTINGTTIGASTPSTGVFTNSTSTQASSTNFYANTLLTANATVTGTLAFSNTTSTIQMVSRGNLSLTNGTNNLLQIKDLSANFGAAITSGAFMDRNSTIQEEFNKQRTTITADTTGAAGAGMGDGGGWGVYENIAAGCSVSSLADTAGGIMRITPTTAGTGCLSMMDEALNNAHSILVAANLPVLLMKVKPSDVSNANHFMYVGMADATDGALVGPNNFIGFANDGGSTWLGKTITGGTGTTTVTCTGQTISTTTNALLMVEVRSTTDVHFFVDPDVTNGISFSECGNGSQTNIPTINLAPEIMWQSRAGGVANINLDVDFYRAWQDDPMTKSSTPMTPAIIPPDYASQSGLAQFFPADNLNLEPGTLVAIDPNSPTPKVKATDHIADTRMVGVVANDPGLVLSNGTFDGVRVVTHGRAMVNVTTQNGRINAGDALTSSPLSGYAMKMTGPGPMIGRALESYDASSSTGKLLMVLQDGYFIPSLETTSSTLDMAATGSLDLLQGAASTPEIQLPSGSQSLDGLQVGALVVRDAAFSHSVIIAGTTVLRGPVVMGSRNAGRVSVEPETNKLHVAFSVPYPYPPHVFVTPDVVLEPGSTNDMTAWAGNFYVSNVTTTGFDIRLPESGYCVGYGHCPFHVWFNWFVVGYEGEGMVTSSAATVETSPSPPIIDENSHLVAPVPPISPVQPMLDIHATDSVPSSVLSVSTDTAPSLPETSSTAPTSTPALSIEQAGSSTVDLSTLIQAVTATDAVPSTTSSSATDSVMVTSPPASSTDIINQATLPALSIDQASDTQVQGN